VSPVPQTPVQDVVAVVGEATKLRFESTEPFAGNVKIAFTVSKLDPSGSGSPVPQVRFSRDMPATALADDPASPLKQSSADWVVEVGLPDLRGVLAIVTFTVRGTGVSGKEVYGHAINRLRVPGIAVTTDKNLQLVMLHEYFKQDTSSGAKPTDYVFDPTKLQAICDDLSITQRKLLATYDLGSRSNRLVVFVTLQPTPTRLMYADACRAVPTSVHANATISVFHCKGKGNLVTLLCHTDNMVVNMVNPDTKRLFKGQQGGQAPDKWLSVNNEKPPKFLVGSHASTFTDSVVWSRIFTAKGVDVMPGNSMHGIINTVGCWMLFRNYNWPVKIRDELFRIYAALARMKKKKEYRAALVAAGYDAKEADPPPAPTTAGSVNKFKFCDLNYAYNYFFKHVVGIDFFSTNNDFYLHYANQYQPHGMNFANTFDLSNVPSGYLFHDIQARWKEDKNQSFRPGPAQWIDNAAGFKTATDFLPDATWANNINASQQTSNTWADVYFYKPDGVSLADATADPVSTTVP
jgi:hypothetical protein